MNTIIVVVLTVALCYVVFRVVMYYDSMQGTVMQRLLATSRHSLTILVQYVVIAGSTITSWFQYGASFLEDSAVKDFIQSITPTEYVSAVIALIAVVTIWARLRTVSQQGG